MSTVLFGYLVYRLSSDIKIYFYAKCTHLPAYIVIFTIPTKYLHVQHKTEYCVYCPEWKMSD